MPPEDRFVCRYAAEPPQEVLPAGRWAQRLTERFVAAVDELEDRDELGDLGDLEWFPDRTWSGRTYVPVTSRTSEGLDVYGFVSFTRDERFEPERFETRADWTDQTADVNADWQLDLCDEVVGTWRGELGKVAQMTLVWGVPAASARGRLVTAELADLAVDQCELVSDRFTLLAPDDYRGDTLDVKLWDGKGTEVARESLYEDDGED